MKSIRKKRFLKPSYPVKKIRLSVMNAHLICGLCGGYLIQATSLIQCMHSFCRTCILGHLKKERCCPLCLSIVHESKPQDALAYDAILQKLVYKMVPGLLSREMKRIRLFYGAEFPISRQSSCDTDTSETTENKYKDQPNMTERWCLLRETEPISVCLSHVTFSYLSSNVSPSSDSSARKHRLSFVATPVSSLDEKNDPVSPPLSKEVTSIVSCNVTHSLEDIYLLCPVKVTINQLLKLIRLKYDLNSEQEVVLCLGTDFLEPTHSLIELAYMYSWDRQKIMHFAFVIIPDRNYQSNQSNRT